MQKLTKNGLLLAAVVLGVFTLSVLVTSGGQDAPAQEAKPVIPLIPGQLQYPLSAQQQALQQQRIRILHEIVENGKQRQQVGIGKPDELLADQQALLLAKLTLAEQPAQQQALLTELQQLYQQLAKQQQAQFDIGVISLAELKRTQAKLLELDMLLLQVKTS